MATKIRWAENILSSPKDAKPSAVLLLLFPYKNKLSIVFIKRNNDEFEILSSFKKNNLNNSYFSE